MPDTISSYRQARVVLNFGGSEQSPTRVALMLVKVSRGVPDVRLQVSWEGPPLPASPTFEDVLEVLDHFVHAHMLD